MKKMIFDSMPDLKKMMDIFEKNNLEYSWHFMNRRYEMHLGDTNVDHVKIILKNMGCTIPYKWGDYFW